MAVSRKSSQKSQSILSIKQTSLYKNWRTYAWYGLVVMWAIVTARVYAGTIASPNPSFAKEPHPIVGVETSPEFSTLLFASLLPIIPLAMCILSLVAARRIGWRWFVLSVQGIVALVLLVNANIMLLSSMTMQSMPPADASLDDTIVKRLQCGDAVRTVDSYTFGAKTFYALKDEGYVLKATYDSPTGLLDSDAACATYYAIRSQYPADQIVLQIFTYSEDNVPGPYLYKNIGQDNVAYGIFVRK